MHGSPDPEAPWSARPRRTPPESSRGPSSGGSAGRRRRRLRSRGSGHPLAQWADVPPSRDAARSSLPERRERPGVDKPGASHRPPFGCPVLGPGRAPVGVPDPRRASESLGRGLRSRRPNRPPDPAVDRPTARDRRPGCLPLEQHRLARPRASVPGLAPGVFACVALPRDRRGQALPGGIRSRADPDRPAGPESLARGRSLGECGRGPASRMGRDPLPGFR